MTHRGDISDRASRMGAGRTWSVVAMLAVAVLLALWSAHQATGVDLADSTTSPTSPTAQARAGTAASSWNDLERGDGTATFDGRRDGFEATADQEQTENAPAPVYSTGPDGDETVGFTLPGGGTRNEIVPDVPADREGDETWVRYRAELSDIPADTDTWQLVLQWHQEANTGSPPIALEIGQGELRLAHQGGDQQSLGPITGNDVLDVVLRVRFSQDPARGLVEVWRDGQQVLTGYRPAGGTLLDDSNYLKYGLYRNSEIGQNSTVTVTDLTIGDTAASVGQAITP